jgi:hypothetical protein
MNWAPVGDAQQPGALLLRELTRNGDLLLDPIALPRLQVGSRWVGLMDPGASEANRHAGQSPSLPSRIQRDRHGGSGAQRDQQKVVRSGPAVSPTGGQWLVRDQPVRARRDLLHEPFRPPVYLNHTFFGSIDHGTLSSRHPLRDAIGPLTPPGACRGASIRSSRPCAGRAASAACSNRAGCAILRLHVSDGRR